MTRHLFFITSAINTKFGVFDASHRMNQTLDTIQSIRNAVPDAQIILLEMSAVALSSEQERLLRPDVLGIEAFHSEPVVQEIFQSDNWDVVKNLTEVTCFEKALTKYIGSDMLEGIDRLHKISGRYSLNGDFRPDIYEGSGKIIISKRRRSQFPLTITGVRFQYMSRLWSWPTALSPVVLDTYRAGLAYMRNQLARRGYCDIEHMLYKVLPEHLISTVDRIGVEGKLGPNAVFVQD